MQESIRRNTLDKYREEAEPKTQTITIRFRNLSLSLKKTKVAILQGVSGQLLPGEVTAVMGPSGSGKTTFLNTLSGKAYYGKRAGSLFINNNFVHDLGVFRNITGFVPQEDIMYRTLTVKEVLIYQANLRLPSSISKDEKDKRVNEVLDLLDLAHVKNTKIGDEESRGISGGQRKRVNIGMELVTDPTLLFLDEPTSMLSKSQKLLLAQLVRDNKSVVLAPFSSTVTKKAKQEAWESILRQLNGVGANVDNIKTLRDVIWANIRRGTIKKVSDSKKTGAGGSELTELDNTVLDILGRESANLEPVKVEDTPIVFESEEVVYTTPETEDAKAKHETKPSAKPKEAKEDKTSVFQKPTIKSKKGLKKATVSSTAELEEDILRIRKRKLLLECSKLSLEIKIMKKDFEAMD